MTDRETRGKKTIKRVAVDGGDNGDGTSKVTVLFGGSARCLFVRAHGFGGEGRGGRGGASSQEN